MGAVKIHLLSRESTEVYLDIPSLISINIKMYSCQNHKRILVNRILDPLVMWIWVMPPDNPPTSRMHDEGGRKIERRTGG